MSSLICNPVYDSSTAEYIRFLLLSIEQKCKRRGSADSKDETSIFVIHYQHTAREDLEGVTSILTSRPFLPPGPSLVGFH